MCLACLVCATPLRAQDLDLNPTRPTISNASTIQAKGVLQVEVGQDSYPELVPGNQQTTDISLFYAALDRLRLDLDLPVFNYQATPTDSYKGVGTLAIGGKVVLWQEDYHKRAPGVAVQYEATLPTASRQELQDKGQQVILLLNHHYGKNGDFDVIVNGSFVQYGCTDPGGCHLGGQQAVSLSFHVNKSTRLYTEVFAQNNPASNTPPGTYAFGGFYHKFNDHFGLDGGMRFGLSDHSASFGPTLGVVFGKRLRAEPETHSTSQPTNSTARKVLP